nr:hypothetical protein [Saccharofermentans sp.]
MKKIVALILVCAMSFALFGCGKKEEKKGGSDKPKTEAQDDDKGGADAAAAAEDDVKFTKQGNKVVFTVDAGLDLKQDAWLGFIPGTKGFTKEGEADEVDV